MKIAFASDNAYPWFNGGIEKRRLLIAQEFVKAGHEVHFFTMLQKGMVSNDFSRFGIHYHCTSDATNSSGLYKNGRRNIWWAVKHSFLTFFKITPHRFDAVDTDAFPFFNVALLKIYSWLSGAQLVVTWYEAWDKQYWQTYLGTAGGMAGYWAELIASKCSNKIISISTATSDSLVKIFGTKRSNIALLPAAISAQEIKDLSKKTKESRSFVVACRLIPEKRVDLAINAMAEVNAKLIIVGVGPERERLKRHAEQMEVSRKVEFYESLTRQQLFGRIKNSKGLIVASEREGLSLISLEAMALGVPVLILNTTVIPKEVRRYCFEAKDGGLSALLSKALDDKSFRRDAYANRNKVIKEFSANATLKVYGKLLNKKL